MFVKENPDRKKKNLFHNIFGIIVLIKTEMLLNLSVLALWILDIKTRIQLPGISSDAVMRQEKRRVLKRES